MIHLLTQTVATESLPLGIDLQAFLIQLGTFVIAFLVLRQWAFKPILKMLEERRKTIEDGLRLGETMRAKEEQLESAVTQQLHEARQEADRIIRTADATSKQSIQAAEESAQKRADGIITEAEERIRQATARERKRLEQELVELVADVSGAVIKKKVTEPEDRRLIEESLKERQTA